MGTISITKSVSTETNDLKSDNSVTIYPNPATDKLFISSQKNIDSYRIQTLTGQTILKGSLLNKQYVSLNSLIKGSYLVCLIGNDFVKTKTFIKL